MRLCMCVSELLFYFGGGGSAQRREPMMWPPHTLFSINFVFCHDSHGLHKEWSDGGREEGVRVYWRTEWGTRWREGGGPKDEQRKEEGIKTEKGETVGRDSRVEERKNTIKKRRIWKQKVQDWRWDKGQKCAGGIRDEGQRKDVPLHVSHYADSPSCFSPFSSLQLLFILMYCVLSAMVNTAMRMRLCMCACKCISAQMICVCIVYLLVTMVYLQLVHCAG